MTTDKTIKSKYQPKQTNVTWVDLSGKTPVEKHFINGKWVKIGGGSGSDGTTNGIPTVDQNIQPNIVWREPTEEDSEKFHSSPILQVADLPEGKLPLFLVMKMTDEGEEYIDSHSVLSVQLPGEGTDGAVDGANNFSALIAEDWSLLGMLGEE